MTKRPAFPGVMIALGLSLVLLGGGLWAARLGTAASARDGLDPAALALLNEVAATYQKMPAYSDHGTARLKLTVDGESQEQAASRSIAFERPAKFAIDAEAVRVASDGDRILTTIVPLKKYRIDPAPDRLDTEAIRSGALGAMLVGDPAQAPVAVVLTLLADPDAVGSLTKNADLDTEDDRELDGHPVKVIRLSPEGAPPVRLLIDPASKLVERVEMIISEEQIQAKSPPGTKLSGLDVSWNSGAIATTAPPASTFAAEPPDGYTKIEPAEVAARPEAEANPLVGKPAPDFAFEVLEGEARKPVSKADLAGKVVLLDFWATWCPPCREELPEIRDLAARLAADATTVDKVVVVALSQDEEPGKGTLTELVTSTLDDLKVGGLLKSKVARVGLDPDGSVGAAFNVAGIPTLALLGPDGVVRALRVGYEPGVGEEIEAEIRKLLDDGE